jgi:hypothetical protein
LLLSLGGTQAAQAQRGLEPAEVSAQSGTREAFTRFASLGEPILLSRVDVDSPLRRIRSVESPEGAPEPDRLPSADPAFKAVLLAPLTSTGRPLQPEFEPPDQSESAAQPPPAHSTKPSSLPSLERERGRASPRPSLSAGSPASGSTAHRTSSEPRVSSVARSAPAKPGPAEIGALRAFTRF